MRVHTRGLSVCSLLVVCAGCAVLETRHTIEVPGSFQGVLPCADCEGIDTTLSLRDDGLYFLRNRYLGEAAPETVIQFGLWRLSRDARRVLLRGDEPGESMEFAVVSSSQLEQLDRQGERIETALDYTLERSPEIDAIGGPFAVRGEYVFTSDAGQLTECTTGRQFVVAHAGANEELLAHTFRDAATANALLVTFEGRLARVTRVEDGGHEDAFVVDNLERIWPNADCATKLELPLLDTRWRLTSLEGSAIDLSEGSPELTLAAGGRATGSGGCNRLTGSYLLNGVSLRFGSMAATRRACAEPGKMELESSFSAMLLEVDGFVLKTARLVLMARGEALATFVAG